MCNKRQHDSENMRLKHEITHFKARISELQDESQALYQLLYEIRKAAGDPEGRLLQDDLVAHIADLAKSEIRLRNGG